MSPIYSAENSLSRSVAFPLRLRQGLLQKTEEREAYLVLLGIMARTPQGSWPGHALFGFHEFFSEVTKDRLSQELRTRMAEKIVMEINTVLVDLELIRYSVDSLTLEPLENDLSGNGRARWMEGRGVTLMLRENCSGHTIGYAL